MLMSCRRSRCTAGEYTGSALTLPPFHLIHGVDDTVRVYRQHEPNSNV